MRLQAISTFCTLIALFAVSVDASAEIRVRCEKRGDRSVVSVDGKNLPVGVYSAQILSGNNLKTTPSSASIGDEFEADFSSKAADIAAGATAISTTFIQGNVTGKILNSSGDTVISDTVSCRTR